MASFLSTIKPVAILGIVAAIAGGIWYLSGLRAELAVAEQNVVKLTNAIAEQQVVINRMKADVAEQQKINQDLSVRARRQQQDTEQLIRRFRVDSAGNPRDLGAVAAAKPAVVTDMINRASVNALRCVELASGASLTEKEKNAKTAEELNSECPGIVQHLVPGATR